MKKKKISSEYTSETSALYYFAKTKRATRKTDIYDRAMHNL